MARVRIAALTLALLAGGIAGAQEIVLTDGSRLPGIVERYENGFAYIRLFREGRKAVLTTMPESAVDKAATEKAQTETAAVPAARAPESQTGPFKLPHNDLSGVTRPNIAAVAADERERRVEAIDSGAATGRVFKNGQIATGIPSARQIEALAESAGAAQSRERHGRRRARRRSPFLRGAPRNARLRVRAARRRMGGDVEPLHPGHLRGRRFANNIASRDALPRDRDRELPPSRGCFRIGWATPGASRACDETPISSLAVEMSSRRTTPCSPPTRISSPRRGKAQSRSHVRCRRTLDSQNASGLLSAQKRPREPNAGHGARNRYDASRIASPMAAGTRFSTLSPFIACDASAPLKSKKNPAYAHSFTSGSPGSTSTSTPASFQTPKMERT